MRRFVVAALAVFIATAAPARAENVDLLLILAADVSRSIDDVEFNLQRKGYAAALSDPKVLTAIAGGPSRAIAVSFVEWSDTLDQKLVVDWATIRDGEDAAAVGAAILAAPRSFASRTSISGAIYFAMGQFAAKNAPGADRRVLDISGDGTSNSGPPITEARDQAVEKGITINGLAIINTQTRPGFTCTPSRPADCRTITRRTSSAAPEPSCWWSRISRPSPTRSPASWSAKSPATRRRCAAHR
jgi:hypothetical protein